MLAAFKIAQTAAKARIKLDEFAAALPTSRLMNTYLAPLVDKFGSQMCYSLYNVMRYGTTIAPKNPERAEPRIFVSMRTGLAKLRSASARTQSKTIFLALEHFMDETVHPNPWNSNTSNPARVPEEMYSFKKDGSRTLLIVPKKLSKSVLFNTHAFVGMALLCLRLLPPPEKPEGGKVGKMTLPGVAFLLQEVLVQSGVRVGESKALPDLDAIFDLDFVSITPYMNLLSTWTQAIRQEAQTMQNQVNDALANARKYKVDLRLEEHAKDFATHAGALPEGLLAFVELPEVLVEATKPPILQMPSDADIAAGDAVYEASKIAMLRVHCPLRLQGNYIMGTLDKMKSLVASLVDTTKVRPKDQWIQCALSIGGDDEARRIRKFIQFIAIRTDLRRDANKNEVDRSKRDGITQSLNFADQVNPHKV